MKARDIEKIRIAAEKLRAAIVETTGPVVWPYNADALCAAVDAIIDAVLNEVSVELVRHDPPDRAA